MDSSNVTRENLREFENFPVKISPESLSGESQDVFGLVSRQLGTLTDFDGEVYTVKYITLDDDAPIQVAVKSSSISFTSFPVDLVEKFYRSVPGMSSEIELTGSITWICSLISRMYIFAMYKKTHVNIAYLKMIKPLTQVEVEFVSGFGFFHKRLEGFGKRFLRNDFSRELIKSVLDVRNWATTPPFDMLNPCVCEQLVYHLLEEDPFFHFVKLLRLVDRPDSFTFFLNENLFNAFGRIPGLGRRTEPEWNGKPSSLLACQRLNFSTGKFDEGLYNSEDTVRFLFSDNRVCCVSRELIRTQLEDSVKTRREIFVSTDTNEKRYVLTDGFYYNIFTGTPDRFLITQESYLAIFRQRNRYKNLFLKVVGYSDFVELIDATTGVEDPKIYTEFMYELLV